ncbi:hypothetical protein PHAVU_011G158700 [Phaseolus vulgaris]|uniref:Protein kinase domain-containing protein n=1 Tax=Phaseolus vulgaris TaxID=3885 RepID=V7AI19_PHAVU|nr:hypothetical protein PHAVU_011G158700g [Phaseolus vulgaris]ESW05179.1 hypothetical protein PHAVU_011G158700g [Phaseolus vulgaris]
MGDNISLRQWLDKSQRTVNCFECLNIFRQIVEIVHVAHSQGNAVHNVMPSCFLMSSFSHASFMDPAICSDAEIKTTTLTPTHQQRCLGSDDFVSAKTSIASLSNSTCLLSKLRMEASWYTSPEEVAGALSSCASDIYQLGVLLFELFCPLSSTEEKSRTMSSLRHRVLPPQLLLKWPKEASFCLWLLQPEPSNRPTIG